MCSRLEHNIQLARRQGLDVGTLIETQSGVGKVVNGGNEVAAHEVRQLQERVAHQRRVATSASRRYR
jgi:hypothetical protein